MTAGPSPGDDPRAAVAAARRLVVKVGSSSLTTASGGLDETRLDALVDALAAAPVGPALAVAPTGPTPGAAPRPAGAGPMSSDGAAPRQLVLVSSGAIAAGLAPLGLPRRPRDLARQQAAASVGQGLLVASYRRSFARHGRTVGQVLLTAEDVVRRGHYRNAQRALDALLGLGVVPVVNENDTVATDEIRFGDNDRLAALVAHLVRADALLLLSDVDGLYDRAPSLPGANRIGMVEDASAVDLGPLRPTGSALGTGGMATKVAAAAIATAAGVPVVLAAATEAAAALAGAGVGTGFRVRGRRFPARLAWLAYASEPTGRLRLDPGAVRAVVARRASLLAAGVTGVEGTFGAGDPVDLVTPDGTVVARGLSTYDAAELRPLLGHSSDELAARFGPDKARELVHRDALALLVPPSPRTGHRPHGNGPGGKGGDPDRVGSGDITRPPS